MSKICFRGMCLESDWTSERMACFMQLLHIWNNNTWSCMQGFFASHFSQGMHTHTHTHTPRLDPNASCHVLLACIAHMISGSKRCFMAGVGTGLICLCFVVFPFLVNCLQECWGDPSASQGLVMYSTIELICVCCLGSCDVLFIYMHIRIFARCQ